jgi:hypothetical protein
LTPPPFHRIIPDMVKTLTHPVTGQTFRLGRNRPKAVGPRFRLKNYLKLSMPAPPATIDYTGPASLSLSNIYENDTLGDCVIAGMGHVDGVLTANAGSQVVFTDPEITALYSAIGGYVPGDPSTDQGCDEQTALNYWQQNGMLPDGSHKITAWMAVDATSQVEVRTALWLFGNLYFGLELPDDWVNPMPSGPGFTWDAAGDPDPDNGHCIMGAAYDTNGVTVDTWGMLGTLTNAAVAQYAVSSAGGELYTVLSQDWISQVTNKAVNGFDASQLSADLDSMNS